MIFGPDNFLYLLRSIVTGGGNDANDNPALDAGYKRRAEGIDLASLAPDTAITATAATLTDSTGGSVNTTLALVDVTMVAVGGSGMSTAQESEYNATMVVLRDSIADLGSMVNKLTADMVDMRAQMSLTADETNARVIKVEQTIDVIGNIVWPVPRDYDEATDKLTLRVLASQLTVSTDADVQLDAEMYVKAPDTALTADLNPTAPSTNLLTKEQWIDIDFSGEGIQRDEVVIMKLITNGNNDTDGEEVLIHSIEVIYNSTIVSYHEEDSADVDLR